MSTSPTELHSAVPPELWIADQHQPHVAPGDGVATAIDQLQQREQLAPLLLLTTGYCALPWILQQFWLLLMPVAAVLGVVAERRKETV